jgi:hypothetical protein
VSGAALLYSMKKLAVLIFCLLMSRVVMAQRDSLAFDDRGKYIYYKVLADKHTADDIYKKSLAFFEVLSKDKSFKLTTRDAKNTAITGAGTILVYKPSLTKHADGQVAYTLKMEIKDNKYRYWLTDFIYTPYFRDRYNSYVPDKGRNVPLEKSAKLIEEKDLNKFLDQAATYAIHLGEQIKKQIAADGVALKKDTTTKKVIHINKW